MGTDIHVGCEVRRNGIWRWTGKIFDSRHDWEYVSCTREVLEKLSNPLLLDALVFHVTDAKYANDPRSGLRPLLPEDIIAVFHQYDKRQTEDGNRIKAHRDAIPSHLWDYAKIVQPFVDQLTTARMEDFERCLTGTQREKLISIAVMKHGPDSDYGREDRQPICLHRYPGDPPFKTGKPFDNRNYDLFAALADVRNGVGFAGVKTGKAIEPIAMPRGIPDDADPDTVSMLP